MRKKNAYVVMSGDYAGNHMLSYKLRNYRRVQKAIKAARRMGFAGAYICKMEVSVDAKLLG